MSTPRVILRWQDTNNIEIGHKIYRSDTPMDIQNMPPPHAVLNPNTAEYKDENVIEGNFYYYRVSAYTSNGEEYSNEVYAEAKSTTLDIHDIFGDNSSLATYPFDENVLDLGGNTNLNVNNQISYTNGAISSHAINFNNVTTDISTFTGLDGFGTNQEFSISVWLKINGDVTNQYILTHATTTSNQNALLRLYNNSVEIVGDNINMLAGETILTQQQWYHVVITHDTITTKVYVNGSVDAEANNINFSMNTTLYFSSYIDGRYRFTGELDQLRLFNRSIDINEVQLLYNER